MFFSRSKLGKNCHLNLLPSRFSVFKPSASNSSYLNSVKKRFTTLVINAWLQKGLPKNRRNRWLFHSSFSAFFNTMGLTFILIFRGHWTTVRYLYVWSKMLVFSCVSFFLAFFSFIFTLMAVLFTTKNLVVRKRSLHFVKDILCPAGFASLDYSVFSPLKEGKCYSLLFCTHRVCFLILMFHTL